MRRQVLINVEATDIRVALLEDGTLVELFMEDLHSRSIVGNIYKGRVDSIIPGLRAVFVNIGGEKNAFLHFDDVLPEYELPQRGRPERHRRHSARVEELPEEVESLEQGLEDDDFIDPAVDSFEEEAEAGAGTKAPTRPPKGSRPMQVGDEILVQVTKEQISTKGPRITTFISLPGRYLVLMPFSENSGGVSRRIEDAGERRRLRQLLHSLTSNGGAFIIRTAGLERDEPSICLDAEQLKKTWDGIAKRSKRCRAPARLYDDHEILNRVARDNFTDEIDEILIDSKQNMRRLIKACQTMVPELSERIALYDSPVNIFDTFEVEKQFQKALRHKVPLRSGGEIIIDEAEAMTAIDVNSGRYVGREDQDQMILKINLEACRAIARQLRLRDIGGLIVIDFIDMSERDHEQQVLREYKRCLKSDRARFALSGISTFGLVEMTRKRVRKSLSRSFYRPCPYCEGTGRILSDQQLWKRLKYDLIAELEEGPKPESVEIVVHSQFRTYLQANVLDALKALSGKYQVALRIVPCDEFHHERIEIVKKSKLVKKGNAPAVKNDSPAKQIERKKKLESASVGQDNSG